MRLRLWLPTWALTSEVVDDLLRLAYLYWGILDDDEEGGEMFWRLDPWNARAAAQLRGLEKQAV
jgi:hypothetical protein